MHDNGLLRTTNRKLAAQQKKSTLMPQGTSISLDPSKAFVVVTLIENDVTKLDGILQSDELMSWNREKKLV